MKVFLLSDTHQLNELVKQKIAVEIANHGHRVAYISSEPQDKDRTWFHKSQNEYKEINSNISLEYFDLSNAFSDGDLRGVLDFGTIHLSGGNTYSFLNALRERNFEEILERHLLGGGVIIGLSAGAMVLTPHIDMTSMCGDVNSIKLKDLKGLNIVDFCFLPHLGLTYIDSSENHTKLQELATTLRTRVYVATESDAVFIDESGVQLLGNIMVIDP
jgi:dipeptidase E